MANTVWGAFDAFRKNTVDLDASVTQRARSSRNFLTDQLGKISREDTLFPKLQEKYIPFGSFARRTKIRPLDDVDMLVLLVGSGTTAKRTSDSPYTYWLHIDSSSAPLARFPDEYGYVNSTKILNKIRSSLYNINQYRQAGIKKTMQAVTLDLLSYSWTFDIVPAVPINDGLGGTAYYLIPNGYGDWIATDPRIDDTNTTTRNRQHSGNFLPTMRLLKYWNNRQHKPRLGSYYFETLALKVFASAPLITSFPQALKYFFDYCPIYLQGTCPDPKNLGPALDAHVDWSMKQKVVAALNDAATHAGYALTYEQLSNHSDAIYWWGKVFGSEFPTYG